MKPIEKAKQLGKFLDAVQEVVEATGEIVEHQASLSDYHKLLRKAEAKKKAIDQKLKAQKGECDRLESEILRLLAMQREQGLAPTAKMKDGTVYTEGHRTPWDGLDQPAVIQALIKLKLPEFLGNPLYRQMKTEWGKVEDAPKGLRDLLIVKDVPYLSVTKGG
jgi:hypothetical protein